MNISKPNRLGQLAEGLVINPLKSMASLLNIRTSVFALSMLAIACAEKGQPLPDANSNEDDNAPGDASQQNANQTDTTMQHLADVFHWPGPVDFDTSQASSDPQDLPDTAPDIQVSDAASDTLTDSIKSEIEETVLDVAISLCDELDCDDQDQCTEDLCDEDMGCINPVDVGASCDDGKECTAHDYCTEFGNCVAGVLVECPDDGDDCTASECVEGEGCISVPANYNEPCDDGDGCTSDEVCIGGECEGEPINLASCDNPDLLIPNKGGDDYSECLQCEATGPDSCKVTVVSIPQPCVKVTHVCGEIIEPINGKPKILCNVPPLDNDKPHFTGKCVDLNALGLTVSHTQCVASSQLCNDGDPCTEDGVSMPKSGVSTSYDAMYNKWLTVAGQTATQLCYSSTNKGMVTCEANPNPLPAYCSNQSLETCE